MDVEVEMKLQRPGPGDEGLCGSGEGCDVWMLQMHV